MAKRKKPSREKFDVPIGLPLSGIGGFTAIPLTTIGASFHEAIDWFKKELEDDTFTRIGLYGLVLAAEAAQIRRHRSCNRSSQVGQEGERISEEEVFDTAGQEPP